MTNMELLGTYLVKYKDNDIRMASRSGGIFTALSDNCLSCGGVVYGCILNADYEVVHYRAEDVEERNRMRGSKYVQSNMGDIFSSVKQDLKEGRFVLFSGTSCQIDGLKRFLRCPYEKLLCVDIVCHGVSSPMVWKDFLKYEEKKHNGKVTKVDFRDKRKFGWQKHMESVRIGERQYYSQIYTELFYQHNILDHAAHNAHIKT